MPKRIKIGSAVTCIISLLTILGVDLMADPDEYGDCTGELSPRSNRLCVFYPEGGPIDCEEIECHEYSHTCPSAAACTGGSCEGWEPEVVLKFGNGCVDQPPESTGKTCERCTGFACSVGYYYDVDPDAAYGPAPCGFKRCQEVRWQNATSPSFVCKPS